MKKKKIRILEHVSGKIRYSKKTNRVYVKHRWTNTTRYSWRTVVQENILGTTGARIPDGTFFFPSNYDASKMRPVEVEGNFEMRMMHEMKMRDAELAAIEQRKIQDHLAKKADELMKGNFTDTALRLLGIGKDEEFLKKCKQIKEEPSIFAKQSGYVCKWCGISCGENRDCETQACKVSRFRRKTVPVVDGRIMQSETFRVIW